jgi:SAM-dependent methyltransferase
MKAISCRTCKGSKLTKFLDLGFTPPADQFLSREQLEEPETYYPLEVLMCSECGLAQLSYVVPPEILYRCDYPYEASMTRTGRLHWEEFARSVILRLALSVEDLVVDIGSNVGVLLQAFQERGTRTLGVEPASNIAEIARQHGIETVNEFFNIDVARQIVDSKGQASVITATNVFAHIDDLDSFMKAVDLLLRPNGVLIIEAPYFVNLVDRLEYDTIYHEHLSYLSVRPLVRFFGGVGLEVFDVEQRDIHGGSFRVYVARSGRIQVAPIIDELLTLENERGVHTAERLKKFAQDVEQNRKELAWLLGNLKHQGKRIAAASAPAKGMTLLNYCQLGASTLDFVTEKSKLKVGRFTPGTHIEVTGDDELLKQMPDYALLLAWNFADEIMNNLADYRKRGGKFIIPIPTPRIV